MIHRTTRKHLDDALRWENFQPESLQPPNGSALLPEFGSLLARAGISGQADLVRMAKRARTATGTMVRGDLLAVVEGGSLVAGFAVMFFAVAREVGQQYFALVQKMRPVGPCHYSFASGDTELAFMPLPAVLHAFPYFQVGETVHLITGIDELEDL